MKRPGIVAFLFLAAAAAPLFCAPSGRQIMEEQQRRHDTRTETTTEVMVLVDKKGNKEQRLIKSYAKEIEAGHSRFLLVFLEPASVKGTALLTWDYEKRANDQWMYLPAWKNLRRVAESSKRGYFMGTDFTFEDLDPEELDHFDYAVVREESLDGQACWVIEAVPAGSEAARLSGYSKRVLWIRKDIYFTLRIDFYDQRGTLVKTQTNHDLVRVQGDLWRCQKVLMTNFEKDHRTLLGVTARSINRPIDSEVFTERFILAERHLQLD